MMRRSTVAALAVLALPMALWGCAPPPPPPATLDLAITAGADQNPGPGGAPTAVKIFLYQLATTAKFERADVFSLTEREKATLGEDLLASESFVLAPGEKRSVAKEVKIGTTSLGVVVLFRDIDRATWRVMAPVAKNGPTVLQLTTKGVVATLAPR